MRLPEHARVLGQLATLCDAQRAATKGAATTALADLRRAQLSLDQARSTLRGLELGWARACGDGRLDNLRLTSWAAAVAGQSGVVSQVEKTCEAAAEAFDAAATAYSRSCAQAEATERMDLNMRKRTFRKLDETQAEEYLEFRGLGAAA